MKHWHICRVSPGEMLFYLLDTLSEEVKDYPDRAGLPLSASMIGLMIGWVSTSLLFISMSAIKCQMMKEKMSFIITRER